MNTQPVYTTIEIPQFVVDAISTIWEKYERANIRAIDNDYAVEIALDPNCLRLNGFFDASDWVWSMRERMPLRDLIVAVSNECELIGLGV